MEELMQYVWNYRLWPMRDMVTVDGECVEVLDTGMLNRDAGPDFFNAKLLIGGQEWIGNVEMHVRASDWLRHGHDKDHAYDSVVLHVVSKDDMRVKRPDGHVIPQLVMDCTPDFSVRYNEMVNNPVRELPCQGEILTLDSLYLHDWFTALAYERLFTKSDRILGHLSRCSGNWAEALYITIARALGFSTNSDPMELLAVTTPLKTMLRHADSQMSVEAILFGQAGLLEPAWGQDSDYKQQLKDEYQFLATKYSLTRSQNIVWKMSRMRPQNFPHRRLAALAQLICDRFSISSRILGVRTEAEARALFDTELRGYWARHYTFSAEENAPTVKAFGYSSTTLLIINIVVPAIYAYGSETGDSRMQEQAIDLLQGLKPEKNTIIDLYQRIGVEARDAFTTQALIQLNKEYCRQRKCIFCRIGHKLLSEKVKR